MFLAYGSGYGAVWCGMRAQAYWALGWRARPHMRERVCVMSLEGTRRVQVAARPPLANGALSQISTIPCVTWLLPPPHAASVRL